MWLDQVTYLVQYMQRTCVCVSFGVGGRNIIPAGELGVHRPLIFWISIGRNPRGVGQGQSFEVWVSLESRRLHFFKLFFHLIMAMENDDVSNLDCFRKPSL